MEYYLALKRKGILTKAMTWMKFKDINVSKISQSQKSEYYVIPLI